MPQRGFHCIVDFEDVSFEACIDCASTLGRCHLTASLLRGMASQARARDALDGPPNGQPAEADEARRRLPLPVVGQDAASPVAPASVAPASLDSAAAHSLSVDPAPSVPRLSVTALVGCGRQAYLKATEPFYQRPDQQYWAYRGTLAHLLVEGGAGPEVVSEQRFERELRLPSGRVVTITGQPDEIDPARALLVDYKTTDRPAKSPAPMHVAQLNVYRWLVAPRYEIRSLGIVYLTMRETRKVPVPIWPAGHVERFLYERAGALADAFSGGAWPAMTDDRWLCQYCPVSAACERGPLRAPADVNDDRDAWDVADAPAPPAELAPAPR